MYPEDTSKREYTQQLAGTGFPIDGVAPHIEEMEAEGQKTEAIFVIAPDGAEIERRGEWE